MIVGNSAAALSAIRAIRERRQDYSITLISREDCCAYSPALTTHYLSDQMPEEKLFIVDEGFYKRAGVECVLGTEAVELDPKRQVVVLNDGKRIDYDRVLIATGASPKILESAYAGIAGDICYLRTVGDARRIKRLSRQAKEIMIVGAGLVSMQIADALYRPGIHLTFVVGSRQVLGQNVDEDCAAIIQEQTASSSGGTFLFGRNVTHIDRANGGYRTLLDTGEELAADMIIVGKGVEPNARWARNGGIHTNQGILVDEFMRTNLEGVYAAGDVTEARNRVTGLLEPVPNWINACE